MADLSKDAISHKGKKIKKYSLSFKKEVIAYAEIRGNRPASKQFSVDERIREWRANKSNIEGPCLGLPKESNGVDWVEVVENLWA